MPRALDIVATIPVAGPTRARQPVIAPPRYKPAFHPGTVAISLKEAVINLKAAAISPKAVAMNPKAPDINLKAVTHLRVAPRSQAVAAISGKQARAAVVADSTS